MITDLDCLLQIDIINSKKFIRSEGLVQFKTFYADEITVYRCLMGPIKNLCNEYTMDAYRFSTDGKIFLRFVSSLNLPGPLQFTIFIKFRVHTQFTLCAFNIRSLSLCSPFHWENRMFQVQYDQTCLALHMILTSFQIWNRPQENISDKFQVYYKIFIQPLINFSVIY